MPETEDKVMFGGNLVFVGSNLLEVPADFHPEFLHEIIDGKEWVTWRHLCSDESELGLGYPREEDPNREAVQAAALRQTAWGIIHMRQLNGEPT